MATDRLSATFSAIADPTRRAILARLASGEATVTELAKPFAMSLPAVSKHLKVLEQAGLISPGRDAQWRPARLEADRLGEAPKGMEGYRPCWEKSASRLAEHIAERDKRMPIVLRTVFSEAAGTGRTKLTIHQSAESVAEFEQLAKTGMAEGIGQSLGKLAGVLSGNPTDRGVSVSGRTLTLTRVFGAPRDLVWTALTDPKHITQWMFANDWESPSATIDLRPGGAFSIAMRPADRSQEGFDFDGTYREVMKPERIAIAIGD